MRDILIIILVCLLSSLEVLAQNEVDALRYSYTTGGGSARYMGLGGAFGALGADLSVTSVNPAGMARYSKSEFAFTPGYQLGSSNSTYNESTTFNGKNNLNITNIGFVSSTVNKKPDISGWKSVQFGFTYNKLHNFHLKSTITGESESSISHAAANLANGFTTDELYGDAGLFYDGYLIDPDPNDTLSYYSLIETDVNFNKNIQKSGQLGETTISMSGNYDDILYVGGTIGIQKINYSEKNTYTEKIIDQTKSEITDLTYTDELNVLGRGINLKAGIIYLPVDWLRVGLAFHTPTAFSLNEDYQTTLSSGDTTNNPPIDVESPINSFSYKMRLPAKTIFSAAVIIKKKGLVSVDYELNNPGDALLKDQNNKKDIFEYENEAIREVYKTVNVLRIGTEWKLNQNFVARAGFAIHSSPIKKNLISYNASRQSMSLGLGFRQKNFYMDFAFVNTYWTEDYYIYDPSLIDATKIDYYQNQLLATFGFRF